VVRHLAPPLYRAGTHRTFKEDLMALGHSR